jgi:FixJ family two-component response regulator
MEQSEPRVAIVDDDKSIRKALLRLFHQNGYRAEAFSSAADFLDSVSAQTPDCVILDIRMPVTTGLELLRQMQKWQSSPPVIVITAHDDQQTRDACKSLGTKHYLIKPIDGKILLEHVRNAVGVP